MGTRVGADVEVQVLGRVGATVDEREIDLGGPRQQVLLATLAAHAGHAVANDTIIDALWSGDPPDGATRTFRSYVARLRRAFDRAGADGTAVVRTASGGYRLDASVGVDAILFETEVADARQHLSSGDPAAAASTSGRALERWRGVPYQDLPDALWVAPRRARLVELRLAAVELRARALLDADRVADATVLLEQHVTAEPFREAAVRLQALALYRAGRDAAALEVLRSFRSRLADEHGLDPTDQLGELEAMVLQRDPRLDRPVAGRALRGYVLHEPIATSPLGVVHRAEQPSLGREVAVTVLPPDVADAPSVIRVFEARLQAVGELEHPHLLPVYDYWREPGGAFVVTRLPTGTLDQAVRAGRVAAADAVTIGEQVAGALAAAHERGVVHGAIGPDAVVVDARGDAFLWGFAPAEVEQAETEDVAALAAVLLEVATVDAPPGQGPPDGGGSPARARAVLEVARVPDSGRVDTAAGLEAALVAARTEEGVAAPTPVDVGPNPYRGLAAFQEADVDVFFGRRRLAEHVRSLVVRQRVVAVVGPSGCGKSSLVRAGVLPALRSDGAYVTTMVPSDRPLAELELALARVAAAAPDGMAARLGADPGALTDVVRRALPSPDGRLVLVVDQFEELFTLSGADERDRFLDALDAVTTDPDGQVQVVVTLRADLLGTALAHPVAGRMVRHRSVLVGPLDADDLHEVVVRPAEIAGAAVEPALVTALVSDAARAPGSLPMVQFALTEVFAAAGDDGVMTLEAYRRIGGIEGVLGQRAEEVHDGLEPAGQRAAHALFRRLVAPATDGPPTRRRVLRSELPHVPDDVIEAFGAARLLRFDREESTRQPTVEVTHEALFHAWPRLQSWIESEADDLRLLAHLHDAATTWDAGGRPDADLYRGGRLDAALAFADDHHAELAPVERDFLTAGEQRRSAAEQRTHRTVRRLRGLTAGLAAGLVAALVAGSVALDQRRRAETERGVAEARAIAASATATVDEDAELALLLALEAVDHHRDRDGAPVPEAERALHRAVTASRLVLEVPGLGGNIALHPDASVFVTEGPEESGLVDVRDATTGASVHRWQGHDEDVNNVAFGPDGSLLATAGDDGLLRVWETTTGELVLEEAGPGQVWGVDFSPDGRYIAASWVEVDEIRVLDLEGTEPPRTIELSAVGLGDSLSYAPDGRHLAVASLDGVVVVDALAGEVDRLLEPATPFAEAVAWSPDGRLIASSSADDVPRISDAETGEVVALLRQHTTAVLAIAWSADGTRLATGADDGRARVFDVTAGGATERVVVAARQGPIWSVALSRDGELLVTGDEVASMTRVWSVGSAGGAEVANLPISGRAHRPAAAFTPDGEALIVSGSSGAGAVVLDVSTGAVLAEFGEHLGSAGAIEVSPDGALVATVTGDDTVHVWDLASGDEAFTVLVPSLEPTNVHWSPDGTLLAVAGDDRRVTGRVGIADRDGELVAVLEDDPDRLALGVAFSADGQHVYAARRLASRGVPVFRGLRIWDWRAGEVVDDLPGVHPGIAASPVESLVAAVDNEGGAVVWDPATGEPTVTLTGHNGAINDITYSADGRRIATAGADGTVRIWDAATGVEQLALEGHGDVVVSVNFSPDGRRLVSTGDGVARVWALDIEELVAIARDRVTRSLTEEECRRHLPAARCDGAARDG